VTLYNNCITESCSQAVFDATGRQYNPLSWKLSSHGTGVTEQLLPTDVLHALGPPPISSTATVRVWYRNPNSQLTWPELYHHHQL